MQDSAIRQVNSMALDMAIRICSPVHLKLTWLLHRFWRERKIHNRQANENHPPGRVPEWRIETLPIDNIQKCHWLRKSAYWSYETIRDSTRKPRQCRKLRIPVRLLCRPRSTFGARTKSWNGRQRSVEGSVHTESTRTCQWVLSHGLGTIVRPALINPIMAKTDLV